MSAAASVAADEATPIFDQLFSEAAQPQRGETCPCDFPECDGLYWASLILDCFDLSADSELRPDDAGL